MSAKRKSTHTEEQREAARAAFKFDTGVRKCTKCNTEKKLEEFKGTQCASSNCCPGASILCIDCAQLSSRPQCVSCTHNICATCVSDKYHQRCAWCKGHLCIACIEAGEGPECDGCGEYHCSHCWERVGTTISKKNKKSVTIVSTLCKLCSTSK